MTGLSAIPEVLPDLGLREIELKPVNSSARTTTTGSEACDRPVRFGEVFATLYKNVGLTGNEVTLPDLSGRPQYLVDGWEPIREVVG